MTCAASCWTWLSVAIGIGHGSVRALRKFLRQGAEVKRNRSLRLHYNRLPYRGLTIAFRLSKGRRDVLVHWEAYPPKPVPLRYPLPVLTSTFVVLIDDLLVMCDLADELGRKFPKQRRA